MDYENKEIARRLKFLALFNACTPDELNKISLLSEIQFFNSGDVIIREGENAQALYIILEGQAKVFTKNKDGRVITLAQLEDDHYFGEQGYLNHAVRTSSVKAITDMRVVKIHYESLDPILKKSDKLNQFLKKVDAGKSFANLQSQLHWVDTYAKKEIFSNSEKTTVKHFQPGEIIFQKGEPSQCVYFISSGTVILEFNQNKEHHLTINKNHIFGEIGVLNHKPRAATARAKSATALIVIPAEDFLNGIKYSVGLRTLVQAFNQVYALPNHPAVIEQFIGKFDNEDAIITRYKTISGKIAIGAKILDQDLCILQIADSSPDNTIYLNNGIASEQEIKLQENKIVSVKLSGPWNELDKLSDLLLNEKIINNTDLHL